MALLFRNRFRVPSARLRDWDYRWPGVYAVTICVKGRVCCLGEVVEADVTLSPFGVIVAEEWLAIPQTHPQVALDEWIIMPNHIHGILIFQGDHPPAPVDGLSPGSLGAVVGQSPHGTTVAHHRSCLRKNGSRPHHRTPRSDHANHRSRPSVCLVAVVTGAMRRPDCLHPAGPW
ncbi:MAG TPA: hypothetical protein VN493_03430 [Thermoanaerobaculia bacterium]|nr:hypothetical protein [Thermoanaerobaculia bacterium]